jgi:hypothetical protein
MTQDQKLEQFAHRSARYVLDNAIIPLNTGYLVFGRYNLQPRDGVFDVYLYEDLVATFSTKRTAVSWCVAERYRQYQLSFDIHVLDQKKSQLAADIRARQYLSERSDRSQFAEIVETKLEPKIRYLNTIKAELEKCVNSAKYLQLRGFSNETARSSRG